MSILKDEKVVAAIAKESTKAAKAETKRILDLLKGTKAQVKDIDNKEAKKLIAELLKGLEAEIKEAA